MSDSREHNSIDMNEDMAFQERNWRLQRVGWWTLVFLGILTLGGAFGGGFIARRVDQRGGVTCEYEALTRLGRSGTLRLTARAQPLRVELPADFLNHVTLTPNAHLTAKERTASDGVAVIERAAGSPLVIEYVVNGSGRRQTYLTANGQRFPLQFFVFP